MLIGLDQESLLHTRAHMHKNRPNCWNTRTHTNNTNARTPVVPFVLLVFRPDTNTRHLQGHTHTQTHTHTRVLSSPNRRRRHTRSFLTLKDGTQQRADRPNWRGVLFFSFSLANQVDDSSGAKRAEGFLDQVHMTSAERSTVPSPPPPSCLAQPTSALPRESCNYEFPCCQLQTQWEDETWLQVSFCKKKRKQGTHIHKSFISGGIKDA